jgi:glycosyltransferase involved in cell wall biosynthesis
VSRVLFLTESFHPILGGGETHIRLLSAALAAAGHPSTVLTRRSTPALPPRESLDGVRVLRVPPSGPGPVGKYAMVPFALATLARERKTFDVVVVRGTRVLGLPGLFAGRALGKRVVLQPELNGEFSGEVFTYGKAWDGSLMGSLIRLASRLRNALLRDADAVVAMSQAIERECGDAGFPPERVALIPHGVSMEEFRPAEKGERESLRASLGLPGDRVVIAYSGRLLRGKGLETLVEAFAGMEGAHLLFLGSGEGQAISVEEPLRERVRALGLSARVTFAGRVEGVAPYLRASDIFAFPSLFEALGIALIEAQASGLPAVGSRTGGIVDVIEDGRTGFLVPPGDVASLGGALGKLVADPALRGKLGEEARTRMRRLFSATESVQRYGTLFRELGRSGSGGSG